MNGDSLKERGHEFADRASHHDGLVGNEDRLDSNREIGGDLRHHLLDVSAERKNVAAVAHCDGKPDCGLAVDPEHRLRRIHVAAPHLRDVAQPNRAPSCDEIDAGDVLLRLKTARHPHGDAFLAGLDHARRADDILRLQRSEQSRPIDAQGRELLLGEFDEDHFVLRTQEFDL